MAGLPEEARAEHVACLDVLQAEDHWSSRERWPAAANTSGTIQTTSKGRKQLAKITTCLADEEVAAYNGEKLGDFRALYADAVATQLFFRHQLEDRDEAEEFVTGMRDVTTRLMRFGGAALNDYLTRAPDGTVRERRTPEKAEGSRGKRSHASAGSPSR